MNKNQNKPKNKTYVVCTENDRKVKGLIVTKTELELTVLLPTGCELTLMRKPKRKLYTLNVGMLEFASDGWAVS
jgi:hypothetical protein